MKVVLFGGSGMVGQAVLRECLLDPEIRRVVSVVRSETGARDPKLREVVHGDFFDFSAIENELAGSDACFFTLGATSNGLTEAEYRRITLDITLAAARSLQRVNPSMAVVFVSGAGTDSSERGGVMWARVKGAAENALLSMFPASFMFRPGFIQPMHGVQSRTASYRIFYKIAAPLMPLMRLFPKYVTTSERLARAMIIAAKRGAPKRVLESADINALAGTTQ